MARTGSSKEEIRNYAEHHFGYNLHRTCDEIRPNYHFDESCQGTVPEAMVAFFDSLDFESAMRLAVSLGGDSDTLACITGGIAAAFYNDIPQAIVEYVANNLPTDLVTVVNHFCSHYGYKTIAQPSRHRGDRITPAHITNLKPNEVFVFGSNLAGFHGGGAAHIAHAKFGAIWGQGVGMQGQSYAIPTMQGGVETIKPFVDQFIDYARQNPIFRFYVTRIGCGIAGFTDGEIAPLFREAVDVENICLPTEWWALLDR
jgi:O-acetyl-ADP-ribose deacetylase (regulator of RNase III)